MVETSFATKTSGILIPGFIGRGDDLNFLSPLFKDYQIIDVCGNAGPTESENWQQWILRTLKTIRTFSGEGCVIVGYSLGARLAMSLIDAAPDLFSKAILLSGNPGISEGHEARKINDLNWANRFRTEHWQNLMLDWNAQEVFKNTTQIDRNESDYSRENLARILEIFSLSIQKPFEKLPVQALILYGENDTKAKASAPKFQHVFQQLESHMLPNAGHRIFADRPDECFRIIRDFLKDIA